METKTACLLALTLSEWLNWVASGRLRLNNRVIQITGQDDRKGFAAVMHHAPDVSFMDDGAFILAELKPNWSEFQETLEFTRASSVMWLRLESVKEFLPVSDRGARLLDGDAYRAHVALGQPKFEEAWEAWRTEEIKSRAEKRGEALVIALGFTEPQISNLPCEVLSFLMGDAPLPNADKTSKLESTRALAWANAFAVFGKLVGPEEKKAQNERLNLTGLVNKLQTDYNINSPILFESPDLHVADKLSQALQDHLGLNLSVRLLVVVFHYLGIITAEKEISLKALIEDLLVLREKSDAKLAANATYLIGRKMPDILVTALLYSRSSKNFPSLAMPELPFSPEIFNVTKKINGDDTTIQQESCISENQTSTESDLKGGDLVPISSGEILNRYDSKAADLFGAMVADEAQTNPLKGVSGETGLKNKTPSKKKTTNRKKN